MLKGNPEHFALASEISKPAPLEEHMGVGFFNIFLDGKRFGKFSANATYLGNAYDEVRHRIARRGQHFLANDTKLSGYEILRQFLQSEYAGIPNDDFSSEIYKTGICWAPIGQEGFDDGSNILQFDHGERVQLLGCINSETCEPEEGTFREVWLDQGEFYEILQDWSSSFFANWKSLQLSIDD